MFDPGLALTDHASERRVEEVRVSVDASLELVVALICEQLQVVFVLSLTKIVQVLEAA